MLFGVLSRCLHSDCVCVKKEKMSWRMDIFPSLRPISDTDTHRLHLSVAVAASHIYLFYHFLPCLQQRPVVAHTLFHLNTTSSDL